MRLLEGGVWLILALRVIERLLALLLLLWRYMTARKPKGVVVGA